MKNSRIRELLIAHQSARQSDGNFLSWTAIEQRCCLGHGTLRRFIHHPGWDSGNPPRLNSRTRAILKSYLKELDAKE